MAVSEPGLCARCAWVTRIRTRRGSEFWKCGRSEIDPKFPKYPRVPVTVCTGYEPGSDGSGENDA